MLRRALANSQGSPRSALDRELAIRQASLAVVLQVLQDFVCGRIALPPRKQNCLIIYQPCRGLAFLLGSQQIEEDGELIRLGLTSFLMMVCHRWSIVTASAASRPCMG
jgi:hypothetical protein